MKKIKETLSSDKTDIQKILELTRKSFPDATITTGDDSSLEVKTIPSGIWVLDNALKGGWRRGSLNEICGAFSTGKTWIICSTIKQAQDLNLICGLIDTEHRYDPGWARDKIGIDVSKLLYARPSTGEEAFLILYQWIESGLDLIGIDSFASFLPRQFAEQKDFNPTIGVKARMMTEGLEKMAIKNRNAVILAANQLRTDIGSKYNRGILSKMTGGVRQYYDAASIIEVRRKGWIRESGDSAGEEDDNKQAKKIGFTMECLITKVNYAPTVTQMVKVEYNYKTSSIDNILSIIDLAIEAGLIKQAGAWYKYKEENIQGRNGVRDYFASNNKEFEEIKKGVLIPW